MLGACASPPVPPPQPLDIRTGLLPADHSFLPSAQPITGATRQRSLSVVVAQTTEDSMRYTVAFQQADPGAPPTQSPAVVVDALTGLLKTCFSAVQVRRDLRAFLMSRDHAAAIVYLRYDWGWGSGGRIKLDGQLVFLDRDLRLAAPVVQHVIDQPGPTEKDAILAGVASGLTLGLLHKPITSQMTRGYAEAQAELQQQLKQKARAALGC